MKEGLASHRLDWLSTSPQPLDHGTLRSSDQITARPSVQAIIATRCAVVPVADDSVATQNQTPAGICSAKSEKLASESLPNPRHDRKRAQPSAVGEVVDHHEREWSEQSVSQRHVGNLSREGQQAENPYARASPADGQSPALLPGLILPRSTRMPNIRPSRHPPETGEASSAG